MWTEQAEKVLKLKAGASVSITEAPLFSQVMANDVRLLPVAAALY